VARAAIEILAAVPPTRCYALAALAHVLLAAGRAGDALAASGEAFGLLEVLGGIDDGESFVRLTHAEALAAAGDPGGGRRALADARARLQARAERLSDAASRQSFLEQVPENARTLALARDWDA
jgi:hypothetical protein